MADVNPAPTPAPVQAVGPPPDLCLSCFRDWCQDQAARVQMDPADYSKYIKITENFSTEVNPYKKFRLQLKNLLEHPDKGYRHLQPYWDIFHRGYIERMPVEDDPLFFYPIDLCRRLNIIPGFDFFADPEQANRILEYNSRRADIINDQIRIAFQMERLSKFPQSDPYSKQKAPELEQAPLEGAADNNVETSNYIVNLGIDSSRLHPTASHQTFMADVNPAPTPAPVPARHQTFMAGVNPAPTPAPVQAVGPPPDLCLSCFRDWCQDQAARVQMDPADYSKYIKITENFSTEVNPYKKFRLQLKNLLEHPDKGYRHLQPYWDIFHRGYIERMPVEDDPLFFYPIDLCRRLNIIPGFDFFADPEQANRILEYNSRRADIINDQIRIAFQMERLFKFFKTDPYSKQKAPELEQAPLEGAADNNIETSNYIVNLGINSNRLRPTASHQTFMADVNPAPTPAPFQAVGPSPDLCIFCFRDWCQDQAARVQMDPADYSKYIKITENFSTEVNPYKKFRLQLKNLLEHPDKGYRHLQPYWDIFHRGHIEKMPVEDDPLFFYPIDLCRRLNIIPGFDFFADPEQANRIREHNSSRADIINDQIRLAFQMERLSKFSQKDPYRKRKAAKLKQAPLEGAADNEVETQTDTTQTDTAKV